MSTIVNSEPFLAARRMLHGKEQQTNAERINRRIVICALSAGLMTSLFMNFYQLSLPKRVPYPIIVNELGEKVAEGFRFPQSPERAFNFFRSEIQTFISNFRTVTSDKLQQDVKVLRVYNMIESGSPADPFMHEFFEKTRSPYLYAAHTGTVSVQITSCLLAPSGKTWQIVWQETERDLQGQVTGTGIWRSDVVFKHGNSTLDNPSGMWITAISWAKDI
jgi:type IV secretory pathway TrbF-like protein